MTTATIAFKRIDRRETVTTESNWLGTEEAPHKVVTWTTAVCHYEVDGAEAVSLYGGFDETRRRLYVPTNVRVQVLPGGVPSVRVSGRMRRKDGSLGASLQEIHRYGWGSDEWPEWLVEIVTDARGGQPL